MQGKRDPNRVFTDRGPAVSVLVLKLPHEEVKQLDPVPTETIETRKNRTDLATSQLE